MKKKNILIGLSVAVVLAVAAIIFYVKFFKKPQPERVITSTEMANLKESDTLVVDLPLNSFVIIDQTKGKINLKRIKVKTFDRLVPLASLFRKKSEEQLSSSRMLSVSSYESESAAGESCCPDCEMADPSTTCCCCEVYIDEKTNRISKSCGNFLEPNCSGPTLEECVGIPTDYCK